MNSVSPKAMPRKSAQQGMTLIELMVTVSIAVILTAVAYPSYQNSLRKSNRAEAKAALLELATRQERFYSDYGSYTTVVVSPSGCSGSACGLAYTSTTTSHGYYTLSAATSTTSGQAPFTITATAVPGTPQARDMGCTALTLNQLGTKGPASCW
jgi:type IV pilus assembly protein PilE